MKVNLGCGEYYAQGWTNVDSYGGEGTVPDVVASAYDLPFEDGSVYKLYAGHFLEHIALDDLPKIFKEIERVLAPDGEVMFVGPDLTRAEQDWPEMVPAILNGEGRWPGDAHLWESREDTILDVLEASDWHAAALPVAEVSEEWPLTSRIGWQYAVMAAPK